MKFKGMSDSELMELVKSRPIGGGSMQDKIDKMNAEADAYFAEEQRKEDIRLEEAKDPYKYETPEQTERRGALTDLMSRREEFLGQVDPEQFKLRFDPMMESVQELFGRNLRGWEETMSERGLMPSGSFAEGADQRIQPSSAYDEGRTELEQMFAKEVGSIGQQAQAQAMAQQLQEYIALLSGYGGATISPGQTMQGNIGFEQILNQIRLGQMEIDAMPDEPSLLEQVLI